MLPKQKVIWVEGMMMETQHFQQQERYFEHILNSRINGINSLYWGFTELELDYSFLQQGKITIKKAKGIFPDGTTFELPTIDPLPLPISITGDDNAQGEVISLVISMDILGNPHTDLTKKKLNSRYKAIEAEIVDRNFGIYSEGTPQSENIQISQLNLRLSLDKNTNNSESTLPICKVQELTRDGRIILDDNFLPPLLDFKAFGWLESVTNELLGIISQRLKFIRDDDFQQSIGSLTELFELLLLQLFNEYKFKLAHLLLIPQVHPERLFFIYLEMLGKLCFVPGAENFRIMKNIEYNHRSPHDGFLQLIASLRKALSLVIESPSVALQFIDRGDGIYVYQNDPQLRLEKIIFAVSAEMPVDKLKISFPTQTKLGPSDKIANLIELQLPGARLIPLVTPPRHIPYYPNSVYFEVDVQDPVYKEAISSVAMALSIVGDFPDLRFDVWGIRKGRIR